MMLNSLTIGDSAAVLNLSLNNLSCFFRQATIGQGLLRGANRHDSVCSIRSSGKDCKPVPISRKGNNLFKSEGWKLFQTRLVQWKPKYLALWKSAMAPLLMHRSCFNTEMGCRKPDYCEEKKRSRLNCPDPLNKHLKPY